MSKDATEEDLTCPMCDAIGGITHTPQRVTFEYAGPELVDLEADVIAHACTSCEGGWLDYHAEDAQDAAINAYKEARAQWLEPGAPLSTPLPIVWVAAKKRFYGSGHPEFREAFRALCEWSTTDLNGHAWVTPVLYEGRWHASARSNLGEAINITVRAHTPFAVTVALAATLGLLEG